MDGTILLHRLYPTQSTKQSVQKHKISASFDISIKGLTNLNENYTSSEFLLECMSVFTKIQSLEDNWDDDGAPKISSQVILNSIKFYKSVNNLKSKIMPTGSNSILFVFKKTDWDLMIEIFESTYGYAIIKKDFTECIEKSNLELDFITLQQIYKDFYGVRDAMSTI